MENIGINGELPDIHKQMADIKPDTSNKEPFGYGHGIGRLYGTCPRCGYCPHCGRGGNGYHNPNGPWYWQQQPYSGINTYVAGGNHGNTNV